MKNGKSFCKGNSESPSGTYSGSPPSHPLPDKTLLCSWNKNFLKEMYRNIQTVITKWCCANIFSDPRQKHLCWKICEVRTFFQLCCGYILILMSSEVRFFKRNFIVKCVIFFAGFLLALRHSARKSEIKKTLMMSSGTSGQI